MLYLVAVGYITVSLGGIIESRSLLSLTPLMCWTGGVCYKNFSTTMAVFGVAFALLVRRDGVLAVPEILICGVSLDVLWSLGNASFIVYHPWNYPVWAALLLPSIYWSLGRVQFDFRNYWVIGFLVFFWSWNMIMIGYPIPNLDDATPYTVVLELPIETIWILAFARSTRTSHP